jgi:hypothetical protein
MPAYQPPGAPLFKQGEELLRTGMKLAEALLLK